MEREDILVDPKPQGKVDSTGASTGGLSSDQPSANSRTLDIHETISSPSLVVVATIAPCINLERGNDDDDYEEEEDGPDYEPQHKRIKRSKRSDDDDDEEDDEVLFLCATKKHDDTIVIDEEEDELYCRRRCESVASAASTHEPRTSSPERKIEFVGETPTSEAVPFPIKRAPITAGVEEIVPEKYRKIFFEFSPNSSVDDDAVWTLFSGFGDIDSLVVRETPNNSPAEAGPTFPSSSSPVRKGNVLFSNFYSVDSCLKAQPLLIGGEGGAVVVSVRRLEEKATPEQEERAIYISGVFHLKAEDLVNYFSSFGDVENCSVKSTRGFAFVTFVDSDSADKCLLQKFHNVQDLLLEVKRSFKRNRRNAQSMRPPMSRPRFDRGPRSRPESLANVSITPFPRHVDLKLKTEGDVDVADMSCCTSVSSSASESLLITIKKEII